jgi:hypothetical protein
MIAVQSRTERACDQSVRSEHFDDLKTRPQGRSLPHLRRGVDPFMGIT